MYKAIRYFEDLKDDSHVYRTGDVYPRDGYKPTKARITELSTDKNRRNKPLIQEVEEEKKNRRVKK